MWGIGSLYFSLEEYAKLIGVSEASIYGIVKDDDPDAECDNYQWNQTERYQYFKAFQLAERTMERTLKYPPNKTWYCQERYKFVGCDLQLRRFNTLSIGEKTEETISDGESTATIEDPTIDDPLSVITILNVDFTDCSEVIVYYPGQTKWEIKPYSVSIIGTTLTVKINKTRLLKPEFFKNYRDDADRQNFSDATSFLTTVDIHRRFPDAAEGVKFIWYRRSCGCDDVCSCGGTSTVPGEVIEKVGNGIISDSRLGFVHLEPAKFNTTTGLWEASTWSECRLPDEVRISYVAGLPDDCDGECPQDPDPEFARALVALAHSNLPAGFCNCSNALIYYKMDAEIRSPDQGVMPVSPFGITMGAYTAWMIAKRKAIGSGGLF